MGLGLKGQAYVLTCTHVCVWTYYIQGMHEEVRGQLLGNGSLLQHMGSQSWQVPVPAAPPQRAPEEVHSESATAVSNGLKTPDLSLRSMTLGEYPRIFHSSQKRLVFPLTD